LLQTSERSLPQIFCPMSFNALNGILARVESRVEWDRYHQYCRLIQIWQQAIDPKAIPHTRPLYINRDILWVATTSTTWAQSLSLSRQTLLSQLNCYLDPPLVGIRFSSARWSQQSLSSKIASPQNHPSRVERVPRPTLNPDFPATLPNAFQSWLNRIEARSRHLVTCPLCQSPTPQGELQRWSCCAYCMRQQWENKNCSVPNLRE
jgi:predicted nucleic acid-binding Zn ribbon protein